MKALTTILLFVLVTTVSAEDGWEGWGWSYGDDARKCSVPGWIDRSKPDTTGVGEQIADDSASLKRAIKDNPGRKPEPLFQETYWLDRCNDDSARVITKKWWGKMFWVSDGMLVSNHWYIDSVHIDTLKFHRKDWFLREAK